MRFSALCCFPGSCLSHAEMKILVSRKYLALIHLVSRVLSIHAEITQLLHKRVVLLHPALLGRELGQPFAEGRVQGRVLRLCSTACFLNEAFVGAECNVFHEPSVREISAMFAWLQLD